MISNGLFIHILQGCFIGTGESLQLHSFYIFCIQLNPYEKEALGNEQLKLDSSN